MRVAELHRYPVKSMLGERVDRFEVTAAGVVGDRAWGVLDRSDGTIASAKQPRKWGRLLEVAARFADEPGPGAPVVIELPDGATASTADGRADALLSSFLGREVALVSTPPDAAQFEEVWPEIDGLAPESFIESTTTSHEETGEPVSRIGLSQMAPAGTFFDVAPLHLLTTATLAELTRLEPGAAFDVRRYRPNVLIDAGDETGFVENAWSPGTPVSLGEVSAPVLFATMRCVMTTLAQGGDEPLPADRATLQAIARHNRIDIGMGEWACAGVYAGVGAPGTIAVGDPVAV